MPFCHIARMVIERVSQRSFLEFNCILRRDEQYLAGPTRNARLASECSARQGQVTAPYATSWDAT